MVEKEINNANDLYTISLGITYVIPSSAWGSTDVSPIELLRENQIRYFI